MAISRLEDGQWLLDIMLGGRGGKRIRRKFPTRAKAEKFKALLLTENESALLAVSKPDRRKLSELVKQWYDHHGINLKDGERRYICLLAIAEALRDPPASSLRPSHFTDYRAERLRAGLTPNTLNHHHAYLSAVFNELARLGEWKHPNPLHNIRRLKVDERELSFLTTEQIQQLLHQLSGDARKVTLICLATGARWSEAEQLRAEQVQPYRITYSGTKSGKVRIIPISQELYEEVKTKKVGRLFAPCVGAFRKAIERAGIELPDGQLTHVLRHTFASHFMMNGGNILTLQKALGHSTLAMTLKYSHLAPDHLQEATRLNPVVTLLTLG